MHSAQQNLKRLWQSFKLLGATHLKHQMHFAALMTLPPTPAVLNASQQTDACNDLEDEGRVLGDSDQRAS